MLVLFTVHSVRFGDLWVNNKVSVGLQQQLDLDPLLPAGQLNAPV